MSAKRIAENGTFSEGLSTIRLVVATEGTTLCATWFIGWLNGVIALMTPSSGERCVYTRRFLPCGVRSQLKICPSSLSTSPAPNVSTSATRPGSYIESFTHRPDSAVMSAEMSLARSRTMAAAWVRMFARSKRVSCGRNACAFANAAFTSSSVAFGTEPITSFVNGLRTSMTRSLGMIEQQVEGVEIEEAPVRGETHQRAVDD